MSSKLERTTFTITQGQNGWLDEYTERTGLLKSEAVRRAVDQFREREDAKYERQMLTSEQSRDLKQMSRAKSMSVIAYIRFLIDRERNRFFKRY